MTLRTLRSPLLLSLALSLGGCASIVGSPTQTIPIASTPGDAKISIVDEAGKEVFTGNTPASATLEKHAGGYWAKKSYTVTITKDGFKPQTIPVTASANGWYIVGNFFFGGAIGWFAVDPFNGKMYTLSPDAVDAKLGSGASAHNNSATDGSITIVLLQDVPEALRDQLVLLR